MIFRRCVGIYDAILRRSARGPSEHQIGTSPSPSRGADPISARPLAMEQAESAYQAGDWAHAERLCASALQENPTCFEALIMLGIIAAQTKRAELAAELLGRACAVLPQNPAAHVNYGNVLRVLGRHEAAIASYDRAITLEPDNADAYSNRGVALQELKHLEAAIASYDRAISIKSDNAQAYYNRGNALHELGRLEAALASYDRATEIAPEYAQAHYNRGNVLHKLGRFDAAVISFERTIALIPDNADAYCNRGNARQALGQLESAIASYDQAIAIQPDHAEANWNKSLALLITGDFQRGWPLYESRWDSVTTGLSRRRFSQPLWLGKESLIGKTILLHSEQGLGDTIQFCRYARPTAALGAKVVMEVPQSLIGLLQGLEGVSELVAAGSALPAFDYHCPLLSLPLAFNTDLGNIPGAIPYLHSSADKLSYWSRMLPTSRKKRVGIVWSGNARHSNDRNRSIPLAEFMLLVSTEYDLISLQKEVSVSDQAMLRVPLDIHHFGDQLNDFTDTAALCDLADIVVSVDTSVAHLAAALGRPTWILLPFTPDWRWLLDRNDSPWYPTAKLYRQERIGDWAAVLQQVKADLVEFCAQ